ncbi:hypothetical protein NM208_g1592 [Fusarium decemcellulare]|uniref:Uncharacterized protein n=1 Tax=Fusarium decemcellulare TaxID=57161 RepID=A0ACC1SVB9_9HYPO|nr:hypothetical protein NM208_g1592 [Fusarium decemcellulare]
MSRAYHHKSRNSCSRCKQRRVKCSMQVPRCQNCQRRGETCDLIQHFVSPQPQKPPTRGDLGLVKYFAEVTSLCVSISTRSKWFWTTELPQQAESTPFLLEGLSAVSALHLAEKLPDNDSTLALTRKHYSSATSQFRVMISQINAENCISIFALSLIVIIMQLKLSSQHPRLSKLLDKDYSPIDSLESMRGAFRLIKAVGPFLNQSSVSSLFSWRHSEVDPQVEKTKNILLARLDTVENLTENHHCRSALTSLRLWLGGLQNWSKTWFELAWWPAVVSSEYLEHLRAGDIVSLLLYGYWCCGIHSRYKEWFVEGYVMQALVFVKAQVGSSWDLIHEDQPTDLELLVRAKNCSA